MQQFSIFFPPENWLLNIYEHPTGDKYHKYSLFISKDTGTEKLGNLPNPYGWIVLEPTLNFKSIWFQSPCL